MYCPASRGPSIFLDKSRLILEDRRASARRVYMYLSVPNFSNHVLICVFQLRRVLIRVYCFGSRVYRTRNHDMPCSLSSSTFPTAISIRVFLERAIHAFFRSVSNCDFICVYYFGSRVERVVWID